MRVLVKDFDGAEFFGFKVGAADLVVTNQTNDEVMRIRGPVARYAIGLLDSAWQEPHAIDGIVRELPGEWLTPKAAKIGVSANCDAIALAS